VTHPIYE